MLYKFIFILCILIILYFSYYFNKKNNLENYTPLSNLFQTANTAQTDLLNTLTMNVSKYPDIAIAVNKLPDHGSNIIGTINNAKTSYATALNDVDAFIPKIGVYKSNVNTDHDCDNTIDTVTDVSDKTNYLGLGYSRINACRYECDNNNDCVGFVHNPIDDNCYLKNSLNCGKRSSDRAVTYYKNNNKLYNDKGYTSGNININYPKNDIGNAINVNDALSCQKLCNQTNTCKALVYNQETNECKLKTDLNYGIPEPDVQAYYTSNVNPKDIPPLGSYNITENSKNKANSIKSIFNTDDLFKNDGYTGVQACERQCDITGNTCVGFDFNKTTKSCSLYSKLDSVVSDNAYDIYSTTGTTLKDRPTITNYGEPVNNKINIANKIADGVDISNPDSNFGYTGVDACKIQCNNNDKCAGFSYDNSKKSCSLYSRLDSIVSNSTNDIYVKNDSITKDRPTITNYNEPIRNKTNLANKIADGVDIMNPDMNMGYTGSDACKLQCNNDDSCVGFSYDNPFLSFVNSNQSCSLYSRLDSVESSITNDIYVKNDSTIKDRPTITNYNEPIRNKTNLANKIADGIDIANPDLNFGYTDTDACKLQCNNNDSCVGFSYDNSKQSCSLYSELNSVVSNSTNDIYIKNDTTIKDRPSIANYNEPIKNKTNLKNKIADGVDIMNPDLNSGYTGENACKLQCNNDDNCVGFSYDNSKQSCSLYSQLNSLVSNTTNDIYIKNYFTIKNRPSINNYDEPIRNKTNLANKIADGVDIMNPDMNMGYTGADACKLQCNNDDSCVGFSYDNPFFSYDNSKKSCSLYSSLDSVVTKYNVDIYVKNGSTIKNRPTITNYNEPIKNKTNLANKIADGVDISNPDSNFGYTASDACKLQCNYNDSCAGFSYDNSKQSCSLYSNLEKLVDSKNLDIYSKSGVNVFNDKGYTTGNINIDYLSNNIGNVLSNVPDATSCQNKCNETDNCDAFVYNTVTKECNLKTDLKYGKPKSGVQPYYDGNVIPKNRPEIGSYIFKENTINNTNILGNVIVNTTDLIKNDGYSGYEACERQCDIAGNTCAGFSFDNSTKSCSFYSKLDTISSDKNKNIDLYAKGNTVLTKQPDISQYQEPVRGKTIIYNKIADGINIFKPELNYGYSGVDACKLQCNNNTNCAGFVYNKSTNSCSFYSDLKSVVDDPDGKNDLYAKSGIKVINDKGYNESKHHWIYPGNDIGSVLSNTDAKACQIKCNETDNCNAYVTSTSNTCSLKTNLQNGQWGPWNLAFYTNKVIPADRVD